MRNSTRNYWLLSISLFAFFLTWSFAFSLFPIWLNQTIELAGKQTGIIFSINALSALFIMPFYGYFQDKLGLKKHLLYLIGALLLTSGPFFIYVYAPLIQFDIILGAFIGGIYFSLTFFAGVGICETYIDRVGRTTGFEFGKVRMWGSLGWAFATFFAGKLFNINPNINFWLASGSAVLFCIAIVLVNPTNTDPEKQEHEHKSVSINLPDILRLLQLSRFWAFVTYIIGVSCIYSVYDQQFPVYFASLFSSKNDGVAIYGQLNSLQVCIEAGFLFWTPVLVNKVGAKNGLLIAGFIMAVRMIGSGIAWDPISISVMKLLHGLELPIMLVSVFKYISINFDQRLSATIYVVGFHFSTQVLASILSVVAGVMYDIIGFSTSYLILGSVVSLFTIISCFTLQDEHNKTTSCC